MHYKQSGSGQETAQWTFSGLTPGHYRVSATWVADPNRVANAPHTILFGSATLGTASVDQRQQPSSLNDLGVSWQDLGGPYAISGGVITVKLSDLATAGAYLIAEAIREVTHEFNVKQPDQFFGQLDIRLIDHLQSGILGITYGHTIWIDRSAAGHGWYVGLDDGAFGAAVVGGDRFAQPGSAAFSQFDLLTVITHELAHVVGYASVDASVLPHDLMTKTIAPGVRRISHEGVLLVSTTSTTSPTPLAIDMALAATLPARPVATEESTFFATPLAALLADPSTA